MNHKKFASKPFRLVGLYVATASFLVITDPVRLPSVLLIIPFVLIFCCLYFSILAIIDFFRSGEDQTVVGLKFRRPRLLSAVIAGFPVLLLILQSVVRLTIWDATITLVIFLLVYTYVSRSNVTLFGRK